LGSLIQAQPTVEGFHAARAGFDEARDVLPAALNAETDLERQTKSYAFQAAVSGLTALRTVATQIASAPNAEAVLKSAVVSSAAAECAASIGACVPALGFSVGRVASALRKLFEATTPDTARALVVACKTAIRVLKMGAVR
jgi:hypothetical protein